MDLELSDDQIALRDNIRNVLEGICPPATVRAMFEGTGNADDLWKSMVDLYWPSLGIEEDSGGVGLGYVEVCLLAEELGRVAAPGPLLATVSQFVPLLREVGAQKELEALAASGRSGGLACAESRGWGLDAVSTVASSTTDGWRLTGEKSAVLSGVEVDWLAVVALDQSSSEPGVFLVDAAAVGVQPVGPLDPALGLADVSLMEVPAEVLAEPEAAVRRSLDRATEQATVAMALHTVGACRRIFEVTLEYAKVRVQYDRVIGSFQALKHRFADLYLAVERANAICYFAAVAIAEDDPRRAEATHVAKAAAGQCQALVAEEGLQLHGGIGFTWENDLHFLLKRAKAGELLCGSTSFHRARLAELLGLAPEAAV